VTDAAAPRIPLATYRLQLGPALTFDDAADLLPYLAALGISDAYVSPFFATASDASHGYDVADHGRFREELGGEAAFARLAAALRRHGLGLLVDMVPNHMGIARARNAWWRDVLENGPASRYAPFFDIDWTPVKRELANKVLLPILGEQYGAALDGGRLRLVLEDGTFTVHYYDTALPVAPRTYGRVLAHRMEELQAALGSGHPALLELKALTAWFATLPERVATDPDRLAARARGAADGRRRLADLLRRSPEVRAFVDDNVRRFNGTPDDPASHDLLDALLGEQAYRLAYWRVAAEEINYRRFFDVNELAAIRMERPDVFEETHRLILRLVREGVVTGLRIDHPDGLYAPARYLARLQEAAGRPLYVVVEKILAPGEPLPRGWPVAGTTGYEFLNLVNGIFVDRAQGRALEEIYRRVSRGRPSFAEIVYESKRLITETSMASEVAMLAHRLNLISEKHRSTRDFTLGTLTRALREIIASFPVYRTYVGDVGAEPAESDRESIGRAIALARRRTPAMDPSVYDWIHDLLLGRVPPWATEADREERADWVRRFQQLTGPITAKGYEDTALYRYHRLVSLNEVGGDPSRFGTPLAEFHAAMQARRRECPGALSATSTHDTKRSEDVRARINVLSEVPGLWRQRVARWQRLNRRHRSVVDGRPVPGPGEEYFIYQTLVGAWPIGVERLRGYLHKAFREAKLETSWINPNPRYEEAIGRFAGALLDARRSREFLHDFTAFQARVARFGAFNSLAQTLIKITAPGVPDFYQGTELWELSLVDPDNRRPVDFAVRRRLLDALVAEIEAAHDLAALARHLVKTWEDGRIKLYLIRQGLACRRERAALFQHGDYLPLEAAGPLAEHVCAFARVRAAEAALSVVPRLLARRWSEDPPLGPDYWGRDSRVLVPPEAGRRFLNVLTGERLESDGKGLGLDRVFASFPVALLVREE
jgi:(1->4)-alpha-D-glucan 1-alpha-D-glucosylmutase